MLVSTVLSMQDNASLESLTNTRVYLKERFNIRHNAHYILAEATVGPTETQYKYRAIQINYELLTKVVDSYNVQTQVFCCDFLTNIVSA